MLERRHFGDRLGIEVNKPLEEFVNTLEFDVRGFTHF